MTTPRIRRNKTEQARDLLVRLLTAQDNAVAEAKASWETRKAEADKTRRALEVLGMEPLPGLDDVRVVYVPRPMSLEGTGDDLRFPNLATTPLLDVLGEAVNVTGVSGSGGVNNVPSHPHRQRIGEKAEINDVWPNTGRSSSGNLSPLMESRKAKCNLCLGGIPYATEQRTEHYVVTRDDQGAERGFEYKPCSGVI